MKKLKFSIFCILFLFSGNLLLAGGGWPQPKGNGYFKLYQWWIIADQHFTDIGRIDPNVTQGIFNTTLYGEYGLTDRLTGIVNFPFYSRSYFNNSVSGTTGEIIEEGEAINSLGDTEIGLQYGLTKGKIALSARVVLGLPLGEDAGGSSGSIQTGDGEFNQMLQIDAGTGFKIGEQNAYANIYGGFNNRSNGFSDELRFGIEGGINLFDNKLLAIARLIGIESLQNGDAEKGANSTSIFANNQEFLSFAPELNWNFNEKWGASVGAGFALSGRIIYANPSYSVGVFVKL